MRPVRFYTSWFYFSCCLFVILIFTYIVYGSILSAILIRDWASLSKIELMDFIILGWIVFAILVLVWKLIKVPKSYVEASILGLVDTRIYDSILPWNYIRAIKYQEKDVWNKQPELITLEVDKSYLVEDLGDLLVKNFGHYMQDGWVVLSVQSAGLSKSLFDVYGVICEYWEASKKHNEESKT